VRLNEIQTVGSHNSYHLEAPPEEHEIRKAIDSRAYQLEYEHLPLPQQFSDQKVRQIELDVFADDQGGKYANPIIRGAAGLGPYDEPAMQEPGIKVLHIQDIDYHSNCVTLIICLEQIKAWSDTHLGHIPITVLIELKDEPVPNDTVPFVTPEPWTPARMQALDAEIRSVFGEEEILTPDDVRGSFPTLEEAILTDGWPTLAEVKDKVLFLMDNSGGYRTDYLQGNPNLEGRVLFTNSEPGQPDAAFVKRNDPLTDTDIPQLVADGYVVRTRADGDTEEARSGDTTKRDAAFASGGHWVSTDYPVPGMAERFGTDYEASLPSGTVARCNPVNAPPECVDAELEDIIEVVDPEEPTEPTVPLSPGVAPTAPPAAPVSVNPRFTG
jgi:hypothetical protein